MYICSLVCYFVFNMNQLIFLLFIEAFCGLLVDQWVSFVVFYCIYLKSSESE